MSHCVPLDCSLLSGADGVKLPVILVVNWRRGSRGTMVVMATYRLWIQNPRVHSLEVRAVEYADHQVRGSIPGGGHGLSS